MHRKDNFLEAIYTMISKLLAEKNLHSNKLIDKIAQQIIDEFSYVLNKFFLNNFQSIHSLNIQNF